MITVNSSTTSTSAGQRSATDSARQVGAHATQAGREVAQSAKEQGREAVTEATRQARNLYGEARGQLASQAGEQQRRAAGGLRSIADEMRAMAEQGGQSGPVAELARQAADRVQVAAGWLEQREPGELLSEVRGYARRNPGTFLVGAAVLGVIAGRLTRNMASGGGQRSDSAGRRLAEAAPAPTAEYADGPIRVAEPAAGAPTTTAVPPAVPQTRPAPDAAPSTDGGNAHHGLPPSSPTGARP